LPVADVLAALAAYGEASSVRGERIAAEEAAEREREAEARHEAAAAFADSAVRPH
jgi:hypothetical protein